MQALQLIIQVASNACLSMVNTSNSISDKPIITTTKAAEGICHTADHKVTDPTQPDSIGLVEDNHTNPNDFGTIDRITHHLKKYYKTMNREFDDEFSIFCEENGYGDDEVDEELFGVAEDSMLFEFDEDFPFETQPIDDVSRAQEIFDILVKFANHDLAKDDSNIIKTDTIPLIEDLKEERIVNKITSAKEPYLSIPKMKDDKVVHGFVRFHCKLNINLNPLMVSLFDFM